MFPRHPSRSRSYRLGAGVAVAALALSVAACGDDDDDDAVDTAVDVTVSTLDATETTEAVTTTTEDAATTTEDATTTTDDDEATTTTDGDTTTTDDDGASTTEGEGSTITDAVTGESVDVFLSLLDAIGVDEITDGEQVTVFVPSDDAFTDIDPDTLGALLTDLEQVRDVLEAHVVVGEVRSTDLEDGTTITALSGAELPVSIEGDTVMIGDATVTRADVEFDQGVIHVVDTVLQLPEG